MKSLLFISNGTKPNTEEYNRTGEEKLTNFSIPIVKAASELGYSITIGINKKNARNMTCKYPVSFYNAEIYRNPFNVKEVYRAYKNTCDELKSKDYHVLHCNTPIGGMIGRICGKKYRVETVIYTAHGFHFFKGAPLINQILYKSAERIMAHWTDIIITMNQEDFEAAKKLKLRDGGKVYKVHGVGINTCEFENLKVDRLQLRAQLGLKPEDVVCISAGDLVKRKNYMVAIDAIANAANPRLQLLICGEGPEEKNLKIRARDKGIYDQVHFLGFRSDIKELYSISDIYLFPSLQEGLPRSVMEAMASGLPVVASSIRGNIDLIDEGKGGYLCKPDDFKHFSSSINKLIDNSQLMEEMSYYNKQRIKQFDTSIVEKEIKNIYLDI